MQRLLRDSRSGRYLTPIEGWTPDVNLAAHLPSFEALFSAASHFPEMDLQEVLMFLDIPSEYDIAIPVIRGYSLS